MKKFRILLLVGLLINWLHTFGAEYPYNFTIFPTLENNCQLMPAFVEQGGSCFLLRIHQNNEQLLVTDAGKTFNFGTILQQINKYRITHPNKLFTIIILGKIDPKILEISINQHISLSEVYYQEGINWPSPTTILKSGKHFVIITASEAGKPLNSLKKVCSWTSYYRLGIASDYNSWFINSPTNDLIIYYPFFEKKYAFEKDFPINIKKEKNIFARLNEKKQNIAKACDYLWKHTGRVPNFLIADPYRLNDCFKTAIEINNTPKQTFNILSHQTPVRKVYWKNNDSLITSGFFSVAFEKELYKLEPYKEEYKFSPDVFVAENINLNEIKTFQAFQKPEDNTPPQLSYNFAKRKFIPKNSDINYINTILTDSGISFSGRTSYLDCSNSLSMDTAQAISISATILPREFDSYRIIVSKNLSFALKIYNCYVTFTTPDVRGPIDYYATSKALKLNNWNHIVVVFIPHEYISFYLNGQLIDRFKSYSYHVTKNSLMIGANEKGRYFNGIVKDVHIWNRALRRSEITSLYNGSHPIYENSGTWFWWLLLLLPGAGWIFWHIRKSRFKGNGNTLPTQKTLSVTPSATLSACPEIYFFGDIVIKDAKGENKAGLFPPKILQLFIYIAYNSVGNKHGVTSNEIAKALWEEYDPEKANNNRKYSLGKLKQILEQLNFVELGYDNKFWKLKFKPSVKFDMQLFDLFLEHPDKLSILPDILPLIRKGPFLNTIDADCFDTLKANTTNQIIDILLSLANKNEVKTNSVLCIEIAETIFMHDNVNEEACSILLRSLLSEGKNTLALKTYERFTKRYADLFGEEFKTSFKTMCRE